MVIKKGSKYIESPYYVLNQLNSEKLAEFLLWSDQKS
jgi:hypothetical protein